MGGWQAQASLSVVAEVRPDRLSAVREILTVMAADVAGNHIVPLGQLGPTHYARFFLTEPVQAPNGRTIPAHLVFMSDFDGAPDAHLARLVEAGGDGIDDLYRHCAGYPDRVPVPRAKRLAFLRARTATGAADYVNTIGRTVEQVVRESRLREAIAAFLDTRGADLEATDPVAIREAVRRFVASDPALRWAMRSRPRPSLLHRLGELAHLIVPLALGVLLLPVLLPVGLVWMLVLRWHEGRDRSPLIRPDPAHLAALRAIEDHGPQNQFTALGFVKPGRFRRATIFLILRAIAFGTRHVFNHGNLAGVKTIHFAHWVPLDGGDRIVFASNFDGSTESYMDDFIDKVAWGLNAVFSNGLGYPATRWLLLGGARNEQGFKGYLRAHQLPTQVWFAAYDRLTARNVGNNAQIRSGLLGQMSAAQAQAWLRLV